MSMATERRRATRYGSDTSMLFRVHGAAEWQCGRMIDMSITGLSWHPNGPTPQPSTQVDFIVPLAVVGGVVGPLVCGAGRVVHVTPPSPDRPGDRLSVALAIEESVLVRIPSRRARSRPATRPARVSETVVAP